MTTLISSQRHRDDEIIAEKRVTKDYGVSVSPVFCLFGDDVQLILDGHHSFEAAKMDGVEPLICELTCSDDDRVCLLQDGNLDDFLLVTRIDADLYDVSTGFNL